MMEEVRLVAVLWLAGLPGVVAAVTWIVPMVQARTGNPPPIPLGLLMVIGVVQYALLCALAVWTGAALGPRVGLRTPILEALMGGALVDTRNVLLGGGVGGVVSGLLLLVFERFSPPVLRESSPPLGVRLLYGGVTEELLARWGLMSFLLWAGWSLIQHRSGPPRLDLVWGAIVGSALLFGLGHLPAVVALAGKLTRAETAYVAIANALFGLLAGFLFWRYGLEAAVLAHAVAHLIAYTALGRP
jgi:hypothetical protein